MERRRGRGTHVFARNDETTTKIERRRGSRIDRIRWRWNDEREMRRRECKVPSFQRHLPSLVHSLPLPAVRNGCFVPPACRYSHRIEMEMDKESVARKREPPKLSRAVPPLCPDTKIQIHFSGLLFLKWRLRRHVIERRMRRERETWIR